MSFHLSRITHHASRITHYALRITHHASHITQYAILSTLLLLFTACTPTPSSAVASDRPTPTVNPLFGESGISAAEADNVFVEQAAPTFVPSATFTPPPPPTIAPTPTPISYTTVTVYDDEINPSWTLDNSAGMEYGPRSYPRHTGRYTLSVVPQIDYGKLFFTVQPDATESYLRKDVAAVAFWLYSGDDYMPLSSLAVSMAGSNTQPYWVEDDKSVTNQYRPIFSETRLYFLDFNQSIPPRTWTEVVIWLDDLLYDPTYEYLTGVYLKNDEGFLRPFYIDNVRLIMTESKP